MSEGETAAARQRYAPPPSGQPAPPAAEPVAPSPRTGTDSGTSGGAGRGWSYAEAERILSRAVELSRPDLPDDALSEEALRSAAEEVGIDPAALDLAIAESRLPTVPDDADGILGPRWVFDQQIVALPSEIALRITREWLLTAASLTPYEYAPGLIRFRERPGALVAASVRRFLGAETLDLPRVELAWAEIGPNDTMLRLQSDREIDRVGAAIGATTLGTIGLGGGTAVTLTSSPSGGITLAAIGTAASVATIWGRRFWARRLERRLTGVLALVARGERPATLREAAMGKVRDRSAHVETTGRDRSAHVETTVRDRSAHVEATGGDRSAHRRP